MDVLNSAVPHLQSLVGSAVVVAAYSLLERRRPGTATVAVAGRVRNFMIGAIVALFGFALSLVFNWVEQAMPAEGLIGAAFPGWRPAGLGGLLLSILVYGLVWDFFQYWFHRAQHELAPLWPSHRVHHSDAAVNASTALRRSIPELAMIFIFVFMPTALVAGIDPAAAWFAFVVFYGWGFFNHADLQISLGPLTPVLSGPQWHRLHHGVEEPYRNCNYAAFFPLLDRLFGTYRRPMADEWPKTGVLDEMAAAHPIRDCLVPHR